MIEPESGKLATALVMVDSSLPFDSSFLLERTNETEKMNAVDVLCWILSDQICRFEFLTVCCRFFFTPRHIFNFKEPFLVGRFEMSIVMRSD